MRIELTLQKEVSSFVVPVLFPSLDRALKYVFELDRQFDFACEAAEWPDLDPDEPLAHFEGCDIAAMDVDTKKRWDLNQNNEWEERSE